MPVPCSLEQDRQKMDFPATDRWALQGCHPQKIEIARLLLQ